MGDAHRRIGGVDVLAAGAGSAVGVDPAIALVHLDIDAVVDHREHPDAGEGGVAPGIGIIGRDADQPVHPGFGLEPAIGAVALDENGGGLDAGLLAGMLLDELHLVAMRLRPAHIHAQQHAGPVLALGAAGAGMDLDIAVIAVGLARQQRQQLLLGQLWAHRLQHRFGIGDDRLVALELAELDQLDILRNRPLEPQHHGDLLVEVLAAAHHVLGARRIVPQCWILRLGIELRQLPQRVVPVKDASSAVRGTASFLRPNC